MIDAQVEVAVPNNEYRPSDNLQKPGNTAAVGDYAGELEKMGLLFRMSTVLRSAAEPLEGGSILEARRRIIEAINPKNVDYVRGLQESKTEIDQYGGGKILLPRNLGTTEDVFELLHGHMSLSLQKAHKAGDPKLERQQFWMEIALAQTLRLCADNFVEEPGQNDKAEAIRKKADEIEAKARAELDERESRAKQ